jgi:hypothetical protein
MLVGDASTSSGLRARRAAPRRVAPKAVRPNSQCPGVHQLTAAGTRRPLLARIVSRRLEWRDATRCADRVAHPVHGASLDSNLAGAGRPRAVRGRSEAGAGHDTCARWGPAVTRARGARRTFESGRRKA